MSIFELLSNGQRGLDQLLESRSDWKVKELDIVRRPLPQFLANISNFINQKQHDKIFHLYQQLVLQNTRTGEIERIAFEKNESINVIRNVEKIEPPEDRMSINLGGKDFTLKEYIENGQKAYFKAGKSYGKYSLRLNNCQDFTLLHLRGNGLHLENQEAIDFISQNAKQLVPKWAGRITQFLTSGARIFAEFAGISTPIRNQAIGTPSWLQDDNIRRFRNPISQISRG